MPMCKNAKLAQKSNTEQEYQNINWWTLTFCLSNLNFVCKKPDKYNLVTYQGCTIISVRGPYWKRAGSSGIHFLTNKIFRVHLKIKHDNCVLKNYLGGSDLARQPYFAHPWITHLERLTNNKELNFFHSVLHYVPYLLNCLSQRRKTKGC